MLVKIHVVKSVFEPSRPRVDRQGRPDGQWPERYLLWSVDLSEPPEHRMTEAVHYALKPDEVVKWWKAGLANRDLMVSVDRIMHNSTGSRATLLGHIVSVDGKEVAAK